MTHARFYSDLPVIDDFAAITESASYRALPADWHVAMCDVRNSTQAVAGGQYRHVNSVGAAAITAVLNAVGDIEVPFSFEGDGSFVCVPERVLAVTQAALAQTRVMAREAFGLDLRIATIPVADIMANGFSALLARYRVSEHYVQAVFSGGGVAFAESLMKDGATAGRYEVPPEVEPRGSFDGFECRWQDIPSRHGETVSLMVVATAYEPERVAAVYRNVIAQVLAVYGDDEECHPVSVPALSMTLDGRLLADELGVRTGRREGWSRWLRLMRMRGIILLGKFLMRFSLKTQETDWSGYKATLARNSDVRKFSDVYRQVLSGTLAQREALENWLQGEYQAGRLLYGLHVADRAHMTCMVFDYSGRHIHFIDGADGGLFLAARAFKERANRFVTRTGL